MNFLKIQTDVRAVLGTEKFGMDFDYFRKKYQELTYEKFPTEIKSAYELAAKIPTVVNVIREAHSNKQLLQLIPCKETAHITKFVNQQKPKKNRNRKSYKQIQQSAVPKHMPRPQSTATNKKAKKQQISLSSKSQVNVNATKNGTMAANKSKTVSLHSAPQTNTKPVANSNRKSHVKINVAVIKSSKEATLNNDISPKIASIPQPMPQKKQTNVMVSNLKPLNPSNSVNKALASDNNIQLLMEFKSKLKKLTMDKKMQTPSYSTYKNENNSPLSVFPVQIAVVIIGNEFWSSFPSQVLTKEDAEEIASKKAYFDLTARSLRQADGFMNDLNKWVQLQQVVKALQDQHSK